MQTKTIGCDEVPVDSIKKTPVRLKRASSVLTAGSTWERAVLRFDVTTLGPVTEVISGNSSAMRCKGYTAVDLYGVGIDRYHLHPRPHH